MKQSTLLIIAIIIAIGSTCVFTLSEREKAVVIRFGKIVESDVQPGLHFKLPWPFEEVRRFDERNQTLDLPKTSFLTKGQKYLEVDAYVVWRVGNVERFYLSVANASREIGNQLPSHANVILSAQVIESLKNRVAKRTLSEVVSGQRDELLEEVAVRVSKEVEKLGINIIDVRVKSVDYPDTAIDAVYNRMRTDREREAKEFRAQGNEESEKIRAAADREKTVIVAKAKGEASAIRGEGDAKATRIYAEAFSKDESFYEFYRSLIAYEESFLKSNNVLILDGEEPFLKYMNTQK